jgi:hypothetical protein
MFNFSGDPVSPMGLRSIFAFSIIGFLIGAAIVYLFAGTDGSLAGPGTVTTTVTVRQTPMMTSWNVTWYAITGDDPNTDGARWTPMEGKETLPGSFDRRWKDGDRLHGQLSDRVGFIATTKIRVPEGIPTVTFSVGSDDGSRLYIGDRREIDRWGKQEYDVVTTTVALRPGEYTLKLEYFDWVKEGHVSFVALPVDVLVIWQ